MQQEELQNSWALVAAYRAAPKDAAGNLQNGERKKLMKDYHKTSKQLKRILMLVKLSDKKGVVLDLSDHRHLNSGRPRELTPEIEDLMQMINR